ncbi:jg3500, partial [Pararge aegeria aegeria]
MSDITPAENLDKMMFYIEKMLESTNDGPVPLLESVSKLVSAKSAENNRFSESGELNVRVCILGDKEHCREAKIYNVPYKSVDNLRNLKKNEKLLEKFINRYDGFLASESVMKLLPELLGSALIKPLKYLQLLNHEECTAEQVEAFENTLKKKMKMVVCLQ